MSRLQAFLCALALYLSSLAAPVGAQEDPQAIALRQRLEVLRREGTLSIDGTEIAATPALLSLYDRRDHRPAWTQPAAIASLLECIQASRDHGLAPQDYHRDWLFAWREQGARSRAVDPAGRTDAEILLTDAFIRLTYHHLFGKVDPERLDPHWNFARDIEDVDAAIVLQDAIDSGDVRPFLDSLIPQQRYYMELKRFLAIYRQLAADGGWEPFPDGPTLKPGMQDDRLPRLEQRLQRTGDLEATATAPFFDAELQSAVKRFQRRHRLRADGVVGPATRAALNVPVQARIDQIRVNLERARWVLHDLEGSFVVVNIAGFEVALIRNEVASWRGRAQVGKTYRKTPVFKSDMRYIVFNPTWTVPPTILAQDVLPAIRKDPAYLQKKRIQVLDHAGNHVDPARVDWASARAKGFPYVLRQQPGSDNSLGLVKFIFPNEHYVFLHDTPNKALFEQDNRTVSSGCIRVENALDLAVHLLDDPQTWNRAAVDAVIASKQTRTVYLREPLPVLLLYWTAMVDDAGRLHFMPDVYDRDAAILEDLNARFRFRDRDAKRLQNPSR